VDGRCGVLIPSPRVTDSRTQILVFCRSCSFLWFSIVSYNNYGGNSKLCFYKFYFWFVVPSWFRLWQYVSNNNLFKSKQTIKVIWLPPSATQTMVPLEDLRPGSTMWRPTLPFDIQQAQSLSNKSTPRAPTL